MKNNILFASVCVLIWSACNNSGESPKPEIKPTTIDIPANLPLFNADSAFFYIQQQVDFGPRVPNTKAHKACALYLEQFMRKFADDVLVQEGKVTAYTGEVLEIKNIIARFHPEKQERIMLMAHWDTRHIADKDKDEAKRKVPFDGANDGGSGVGVLMELARIFAQQKPDIGVDIILFDAEDYGNPEDSKSYCLGSQYFAANLPFKQYYPKYAILLDMVGAQGAKFYKEGYSMQTAAAVMNRVWAIARQIGYGDIFINEVSPAITDDHYFINTMLQIPAIDIIQYDPGTKSGFGDYWHTHDDNMEIIDRFTLKAVGSVLIATVYSEKVKSEIQ
jgi:Zn-dependent M28 family amino/carboxypeptidase